MNRNFFSTPIFTAVTFDLPYVSRSLVVSTTWCRTGHASQTSMVLQLRLQGLEDGDEHPPTLSCAVWSTFLTTSDLETYGRSNVTAVNIGVEKKLRFTGNY